MPLDLGMPARLSSDQAGLEDKKSIVEERIKVNELIDGDVLDITGNSIFTGENHDC